MSVFDTIGFAFVVITSAFGTLVVAWATYRHLRRTLDNALRGEIEQRRDVLRAQDQIMSSRAPSFEWLKNLGDGPADDTPRRN